MQISFAQDRNTKSTKLGLLIDLMGKGRPVDPHDASSPELRLIAEVAEVADDRL